MLRASAQHILVKPLCGSLVSGLDTDFGTPLATLLRIDDLTVLIDCGATADFDDSVLNAIMPHAKEIDAVLLTSPELRCCGSLPKVLAHLRPEVTVVATIAAAKLGLMSTVTHLLDRFPTCVLDAPPPVSVAEIHAAFKRVREVQFEQAVRIVPVDVARTGTASNAAGVMVKALPSGRVVGGAVYTLARAVDKILVALNATPSAVAQASVRGFDVPAGCSVLVADAGLLARQSVSATIPSADGDTKLLRVIRDTSRRGGSVIIPTDTFARGAELIVRLSKLFATEGLSFPLIFACPRATPLASRLRTMSEFMASGLFTEDQSEAFPGVIMASSVDEVDSVPGGKCIVAHSSSWGSGGIAAALLPAILSDPFSCVILADAGVATPEQSNIGKLLSIAAKRAANGGDNSAQPIGPWGFRRQHRLEGAELSAYHDELAAARRGADAVARSGADAASIDQQVRFAEEEGGAARWSDDDDDDTTAKAPPVVVTARREFKRLLLPARYPPFSSPFVLLPGVQLPVPASGHLHDGDSAQTIYGTALDEADLRRYRSHLATHSYEETELTEAQLIRSALQVDSIPSMVTEETVGAATFVVKAAIHVIDWSGLPTAVEYRGMFSSNAAALATVRKVVLLHGSPAQTAVARAWFQEQVNVLKLDQSGLHAPASGGVVDVATPVYTLEARVDPALFQRVKFTTVPTASGEWSLSWTTGGIAVDMAAIRQAAQGSASSDQVVKRHRAERDGAGEQQGVGVESTAAEEEIRRKAALPVFVRKQPTRRAMAGDGSTDVGSSSSRHDAGSVFIGEVTLDTLQTEVTSSGILQAERAERSQLLVVSDGIAVRKREQDGQVACEATVCPELFAVRGSLYKQFSCIL